MQTEPATLDDAIAAFLKAELDSPTEAGKLEAVLTRLNIDARFVARPCVNNTLEQSIRWSVFRHYRGGESLFETLDLRRLKWVRAWLDEGDLRSRIRTSRHHFETTYETTDPVAVAELWSNAGRPNGVLDRIRAGEVLEPPLLIGTPARDCLVILEGHNRVISYLRDLSAVALPLPTLIGCSAAVTAWREWP